MASFSSNVCCYQTFLLALRVYISAKLMKSDEIVELSSYIISPEL